VVLVLALRHEGWERGKTQGFCSVGCEAPPSPRSCGPGFGMIISAKIVQYAAFTLNGYND